MEKYCYKICFLGKNWLAWFYSMSALVGLFNSEVRFLFSFLQMIIRYQVMGELLQWRIF